MAEKSDDQSDFEIRYLSEMPVKAPAGGRRFFSLIGTGFSEDMDVFISKSKKPSDRVREVKVCLDSSTPSTDKLWRVVAMPALGLDHMEDLWVVAELEEEEKSSAIKGFWVV